PMAWTIDRYKAIDPRTINLLVDEKEDRWSGVQQLPPKGKALPDPVGPDRAVLWSFRDEDVFGRLDGYPILDQAYEPWYWKAAMNLFANRYFERRADPTPKARASAKGIPDAAGRTTDGLTYMGQVIQAMKQGAYVILPGSRDKDGNFEYELEYMLDDKRGDMYQQRVDKLGIQILRGLWITDRAGTSGGAGGIGTGEAEAHMETLAGTLEMIVDEFLDEVLNPQVVDPLVLYNFGQQALDDSQTRVKGSGLSSSMRDLLSKILIQLMTAEQFMAGGKRIPLSARLDGVGIMQQLELPMVSAKEAAKALPTDEDDPAGAPGGASDTDPGDDEDDVDPEVEKAVAKRLGKRGVIDPGSREALSGAEAELYDRIIKEVDLRVSSVRKQGLAVEPAAAPADRTVPIELHVHQGDTTVNVPPGQTTINPTVHAAAPPVTIQMGDVHAALELKPGERKTVELKGPNGERITGQITVKREGE
ncbi:MAG TPA: hypothetical protein VJU16_06705, partial [Planctomycetota bacterium]|nr:hypothetical protein [Planctomycetota bacterium]